MTSARNLADQPDDWTEPGTHPVTEGIFRIPVPLAIDGLHAVNVYAVVDGDELTVIDSGWAGPETRASLDAGLAALGACCADVTRFVITHAHWDHYTQAVALRSEFGTRVLLGAQERPTIDAFDLDDGVYPEQARRLRRCSAGALADLIDALDIDDSDRRMDFSHPDVWLADGELVRTAGRELEVLATPGHTRGHIVLRDPVAGVLFAGDHILPHITPSIGVERAPERAPLISYLHSLRLVRDQPDLILLPAHGAVSPTTHLRIDEILAHHEQRLALVAGLVRDGRSSAYEVAVAMTWTRHGRALADLGPIHQSTAVLEVQAHLDVLLEAGVISDGGTTDIWRYTDR